MTSCVLTCNEAVHTAAKAAPHKCRAQYPITDTRPSLFMSSRLLMSRASERPHAPRPYQESST